MNARAPVYVLGLGAETPVGRDPLTCAASVLAGVSGARTHPYMVDRAGERMLVARAPWLDIDCQGIDRFEALLFPAIDQALAPIADLRDPSLRVAMAIGLPPERPGRPIDLGVELRFRVGDRYPGQFVACATFETGHASGLLGMHAALGKMADRAFDACLVAGVESYLAPETLEWLEAQDQLHGAGTLNNAWGFIPGEGAGAVLLVTDRVLDRLALDPLARVLSVGRGLEANRIKTETVCIGEGLTAAFRDGLSGLPAGAKVTDMYCDLNGEPYRADEFGFAALRTRDAFVSASHFVAPADCWGDVSAASGPLGVALSVVAAHETHARGPYAFLWASSEGGERAAALLEVPQVERE